MTDSLPTFLRKRAFSISSQDEDAFECPPTPTKRRSGAAFFMTRVQVDRSLDGAEDESDTQETTPATPDPIMESPLGAKTATAADGEPSSPLTKGISVENITPPRTPTRRSTRQQAAAAAAVVAATVAATAAHDETDEDAPESVMESPPPRPPQTPRLTRGMTTPTNSGRRTSRLPLGLSSPSTRNNNNSTGLTPSLTRIFKDIQDAENAAPSHSSTNNKNNKGNGSKDTCSKTPSYSTPRRLGRTMSGLQGIIPPKNGLTVSNGTLKRCMSSPSLPVAGSLSLSEGVSSLPAPFNYYQEAKALFRRSAEPHRLTGRNTEREVIQTFCRAHMLTAQPGSLYISGQPGTGKTALLKELMREMASEFAAAEHKVQVATVNCMTVKDPRQIYQRVLEEMGLQGGAGKDKEGAVKALETIVLDGGKRKTMYVLILDEMDQLVTKDQEVLYKLFEWTTREKSRLTLIGIANALDMTDRFLPRLKAKDVEPQLLNFNPYQVADVRNIILDRLFSLEEMFGGTSSSSSSSQSGASAGAEDVKKPRLPPLMQRPAIELCARKVAAGTGDLRKALDICRQAIEMVEMEVKKAKTGGSGGSGSASLGLSKGSSVSSSSSNTVTAAPRLQGKMPLQEISVGELENRGSGRLSLTKSHSARLPLSPVTSPLTSPLSSPMSSSSSSSALNAGNPFMPMALQDAPKVTIAHVNKALAAAFGSPAVQMMRGLNLHQQILLSVLVILLKSGKGGDCTVGKLLDQYAMSCKATNKVAAVSKSESQDLINMLEANGLLTVGKAKEERNRKIGLVPRESEVVEAVKGQDVVRIMLVRAGVAVEG